MPDLQLDVPWIGSHQRLGEIEVQRGRSNALTYDDGITLAVLVLDPSDYQSAEALLQAAEESDAPGRVALAAGVVPLEWRAALRRAGVSFVDVSGVAEIQWPRLRISTGQFARPAVRRRASVPMQKGHAVVVQELLIATVDGESVTVGGLAERAGVSASTASRAVGQLAQHGLVEKHRMGASIHLVVPDPIEVADLLASRTAWPQGPSLSGYLWGQNIWDVASNISEHAAAADIPLAVTGRVATAFLGVMATSSPQRVHCWVSGTADELEDVARQLGLEPAAADESNVVIAADPWNVGLRRREIRTFERWTGSVVHPLRAWCDLHEEPRGLEFASQLWKAFAS